MNVRARGGRDVECEENIKKKRFWWKERRRYERLRVTERGTARGGDEGKENEVERHLKGRE